MKKRIYYINDGLDGIILAKSRNQAIGILAKCSGCFKKQDIRLCAKRIDKDYFYHSPNGTEDWWISNSGHVNIKGKSRLLGYCE